MPTTRPLKPNAARQGGRAATLTTGVFRAAIASCTNRFGRRGRSGQFDVVCLLPFERAAARTGTPGSTFCPGPTPQPFGRVLPRVFELAHLVFVAGDAKPRASFFTLGSDNQ